MVSKGHGGLGKGLGALLKNREITPAKDQVQEIAADEIRANRYQPRQNFDEAALEDLSESIRQYGILQPLIVRRLPEKGYELIAGERRLRAAPRLVYQPPPPMIGMIAQPQPGGVNRRRFRRQIDARQNDARRIAAGMRIDGQEFLTIRPIQPVQRGLRKMTTGLHGATAWNKGAPRAPASTVMPRPGAVGALPRPPTERGA